MSQNYYVVGGEYADTSFTAPAAGTALEVHGPFGEREAKLCWRDFASKTIDNAMVRYFLKSEDELGAKTFWVVGGEYADISFTRLQPGKQLEVYGPFDKWDEALGFWRGLTSKSVDDAMMRYDIRENYQPGDAAPTQRIAGGAASSIAATTKTKTVAVACPPAKAFTFLADQASWPKWAAHATKAGNLTIKGEAASGVIDHAFVDESGAAWNVPGRVVPVGAGAVVILTFIKPPQIGDAAFTQVMRQIDDELLALKRLLEA